GAALDVLAGHGAEVVRDFKRAETGFAHVPGAELDPFAALAAGKRYRAAEGGGLGAGGERGCDRHGDAPLLTFPVGFRRAGLGTYLRAGLASRSHPRGCRSFAGPFP